MIEYTLAGIIGLAFLLFIYGFCKPWMDVAKKIPNNATKRTKEELR